MGAGPVELAKAALTIYNRIVSEPIFLSSQLLLAMPGIGDPRFERAVIAMCVHDQNGALGIGIGSEIDDFSFRELLEQLEIEPGVAPDVPVLSGGPVEPQRGFVLHSQDWTGDGSLQVGESYTLTSTLDVLKAIAEGRGPARWIAALGYSGWGAGQLEAELTRHGWFSTAADPDIVFDTLAADRWTAAFAKAGIDPRLLTATPGRA